MKRSLSRASFGLRHRKGFALAILLLCLTLPSLAAFAQSPYINSISTQWMNPVRVPNSWSSVDLTIDGGNFTANSIVHFTDAGGGYLSFSESIVSRSANSLTVRFSPPSQPGEYFIDVENSGIRSGRSAFGVVYGSPDISSMTPTSANEGESVTLTFGGGSYVAGVTEVVLSPGNIRGVLGASRTFTFIAPTSGLYYVALANPSIPFYGGGGSSGSRPFTVNTPIIPPAPQPAITSSPYPSSVEASPSGAGYVDVQLSGQNFMNDMTATFNGQAVSIINRSGTNYVWVRITGNLYTQANTYTIAVTNPPNASGGGGSSSVSFTVTAPIIPPAPQPAITSSPYPSSVEASPSGAGYVDVQLSGQNFMNDMTATFNGQAVSIINRSGTNYVWVRITGNLYTQANTYTIAVTNPPNASGGGGSSSVSFTVTQPVPTVPAPTINGAPSPSSITTSPDGSGSVDVQLTGQNFADNMTAEFNNQAVSVISRVGSQSVIIRIPGSMYTQSGNYTIRLTNPPPPAGQGGGSATAELWANGASLTLTSITPANISTCNPPPLEGGQSGVLVTIRGTGFVSGMTVRLDGGSYTFNTNVISSTELTFFVADGSLAANPSGYTIEVCRPITVGGGCSPFSSTPKLYATSPSVLSPQITGLNPSVFTLSAPMPQNVTLLIGGINFAYNATVTFNGVPVSAVANGSSSITATIPGALITRTGDFEVVVTNPPHPTCGGGGSSSYIFRAALPAPTIVSVNPTPVEQQAISGGFTLTLTGTGFAAQSNFTITLIDGTVISLNQYLQQSSFSGTQARFIIPDALARRLFPHNYTVSVNNPNCNLATGNPTSSCTASGEFVVIAAPQPQFTLTSIQASGVFVPFNITTCEWEQRAETVTLTGTEFDAACKVIFTNRTTGGETEFTPSLWTPTTLTVTLPFEFISQHSKSYNISVYKPKPISDITNGETKLFAHKPLPVRFDISLPNTQDPIVYQQSISRLAPNNKYTARISYFNPFNIAASYSREVPVPFYSNNVLEIEINGTNFYPWTVVNFFKPLGENPYPVPFQNNDSKWQKVEMVYINCNKIIVRIEQPELYRYVEYPDQGSLLPPSQQNKPQVPHNLVFWNPAFPNDPKIQNNSFGSNSAKLFIDNYFIPEVDGPHLISSKQCITPTSISDAKLGRINWLARVENVYPIGSKQKTQSGLEFLVKRYTFRLVPTTYAAFSPDPTIIVGELARVSTTPELNAVNTNNFQGMNNVTEVSFITESFFYAGQYDIVLDYEYDFLSVGKLIDYQGSTSTVPSDNITYINTFDNNGLDSYHKPIHTKYRLKTEDRQPISIGQPITKSVEISYGGRLLGQYQFEQNDAVFNPTVILPTFRDRSSVGSKLTMAWKGWYLTKDYPAMNGDVGFYDFKGNVTYDRATPYNFTNTFETDNSGMIGYSNANFIGVGVLSSTAMSQAGQTTIYRRDDGITCPRTVVNMEIRRPTISANKTAIIIGKDSEITVDCDYCVGTPTFSLGGQIVTAILASQSGYRSTFRVQIPASITPGSKTLFVENNFANPTAISAVTPFSSLPTTITVNNATAVVTSITPSEITLPASSGPTVLAFFAKAAASITNAGDITVTLLGQDFVQGMKVFVNGRAVSTTYLDSNHVTVVIPAAMLENPALLNITAQNIGQLPPDSTSQSQPIIFRVKTPVPVLTSLSTVTTTATLDSRTWTLTVSGQNFFPGARVIYNGTTLATSAVKVESATSLRVVLPDVPLTSAQYTLAVVNPSPTDSASNKLTLNVVYPQPMLHATLPVSPVTTTATLAPWMLTLRGGNFSDQAVVSINGQSVPFVYVNSTQLKVPMPETAAIAARTYRIVITNPTPGGGSTDTLTVNVVHPTPVLDSLSITRTMAGSPVSIRLVGSRFASSAGVLLNGTTLTSGVTVESPTSILVALTDAQVRTVGNYNFSVNNPAPGGGTSSVRTLRVVPAGASTVEFSRVTTAIVAGSRLSNVTLRFRDESGNLTDFDGVLRFSNTSGTSTGTLSLRRSSIGVSTATATRFNLADTYTLSVDSVPAATGKRDFEVVPATDFSVVVSGVPTAQVAGATLPSFTVSYFDRLGNATDDRLGEIRIRHDQKGYLHVLPRTQTDEGVYTTSALQITTTGTYSVFVTGISVSNITGNRTVSITPAATVLAEFQYVDSSFAAGSKQTTFRVTYRDSYGNLADGPTTVAASGTTELGTSTASITLTKISAGVYTAQATAFTVPGAYNLAIAGISQYSGQRAFSVTGLSAYYASVSTLPQTATAGVQLSAFTIRLTDRLNNPITGNIGTVALRQSRGFYHALSTQAQANGLYSVSGMQLTTIGTYTISIGGIATENITGNRVITVEQAPVASAAFQYVDSSFNAGGKQVAFRVTYRDAFGNLLDGPESVTAVSGSSTSTIALTKISLGVYTAAITTFTVPGAYTLSVAGISQYTGQRTFTVNSIAASNALVTGVPPALTAGTQLGTFAIRLTDSQNNPVSGNIGAVTLRHERGFTHTLLTQAQANGVYSVQGVPVTTVGTYTVNVGGIVAANITGNRAVVVSAAPLAVATFQYVDTLLAAGSKQTAFRVTYRDSFGNLVNGPVSVTASNGGTSTATVTLAQTSLGVYTAEQTAFTLFGNYTLAIAGVSQYAGARSFSVTPLAASNAEVSGVQAALTAGAQQGTITIRISDRYGNRISTNIGTVSIRHERGFMHVLPTQNNGEGVYMTTTPVQLTTVGTYTVNIAGITALNVTGNRSVLITPASVASAVFQSVDTSITAGGKQVAFRVTYRDGYGNLVEGPTTVTASNGSSTASIALTSVSNGVYTAVSTPFTIAGNYTLTIAGVTSEGTRTFTVLPNGVATVEIRGVQASINKDAQQSGITLAIADRYGNPTDRASILRFTRTTTNPASTGTITLTRTALGVMTAEATAFSVVGTYRLSVDGISASALLGTTTFTVTTAATTASSFKGADAQLTTTQHNTETSVGASEEVVAGVMPLSVALFPNPASESVTLTGSGFAEGRLVSVTLVNALGQTVMTLTQQPIGGNLQANVDVRQVPSGAYTAVLSDGVVQRSVRFVKR